MLEATHSLFTIHYSHFTNRAKKVLNLARKFKSRQESGAQTINMAQKLSSTTQNQIEAIKASLRNFTEAVSIEELVSRLSFPIPHRTLQRRLNQMRQDAIIMVTGDGKATRYLLAITDEIKNENDAESQTSTVIPISGESRKIIALVTRPLQQRIPVGYQQQFLESYIPNTTRYLSQKETKKLAEVGHLTDRNLAAGTYNKIVLERLLIDLSYNSSRLEGNTYSLLDTQRLISLGETPDNKTAMESQMILNHKQAIEFITMPDPEIGINRYTLLNLHALLSDNLLSDPAASGRLRIIPVGIEKSIYTPLAIPQSIEQLFEMILHKGQQILDPFEQAFFLMVQLPYLQPFEDVNKRVSRLAANIPFHRENLSPLSFIDVPGDLYTNALLSIYELNNTGPLRDLFLWAYERSAIRFTVIRQSLGEPDLFRLKYRLPIRKLVTEIVSGKMDKKNAGKYIEDNSIDIPRLDRKKFIEYVNTELLALHDGNFARYMITPKEFKRWKEDWDKQPQ